MNEKSEQTPFDQKLFLVFITTFASMTVFEFAGQFLYPYPPDWRSCLITSLFVSGLAVVIAFFPINATYIKNVELLSEINRRFTVEKELRESKSRLSSIIHVAPIGIGVVSDHHIQTVNDQFCQITGYTADELTGKSTPFLYPTHLDFDYVRKENDLQIAQKGSSEIETRWQKKDGRIIDILLSSTPVDPSDMSSDVTFTALDITERKQAENALLQANKNLNLLSSITRHDINNQLMALNGFVELLHMKIVNPLFEDYFSRINEASNRINAMIQFTKEYEVIGINAAMWQDLRTIVNSAEKGSALGKFTLKNDLPVTTEVFADPLIVKVFFNLIDNALRHGDKLTTIRFSLEDHNGNRIIVCEDDGVGVAGEDKDKIFERGFGKNTGFGLAISRDILSITGITITETGVPGKGARFEIMLPKEAYRIANEQEITLPDTK
jgi:PAS domain S-box-containing protein